MRAVKAQASLHIREPSAFIHKICFDGEVKNTFLKIMPILIVDLTCDRKKHAENF